MAGVGFTVTSGAVALTASTAKTMLQIVAASNQRVLLKKLDIASNGGTASDPGVLVELVTQTTAGTMTALTLAKRVSSDSETLQTTAQSNATAEPTTSTPARWDDYYQPQTGLSIVFDPPLQIVGGARLGVRLTPGTLTAATNATVTADCEE